MTSQGESVIGSIANRANERLQFVGGVLKRVFSTRLSDNIIGERYSKLIINACISSLAEEPDRHSSA